MHEISLLYVVKWRLGVLEHTVLEKLKLKAQYKTVKQDVECPQNQNQASGR